MADPTLPSPWAADEAPGPTCNLGETRALDLAHGAQLDDVGTKLGLKREWETDVVYRERIRRVMNGPREAPCSLLPAAGACDAHRALVAERDALRAELDGLREQMDAAFLQGAPHQGDGCPTEHDAGCNCTVETLVHNIRRAERAEADNARLRAELAALVQTGEKLRQDLDRLSGQALDLGRDTGRIHRALDEAGVPKTNPEPGKPWRIDDRVRWVLERLETTGELVDHLEGQLAETGAELADVKHQLQRLQLSACRLVAVNGGRA